MRFGEEAGIGLAELFMFKKKLSSYSKSNQGY